MKSIPCAALFALAVAVAAGACSKEGAPPTATASPAEAEATDPGAAAAEGATAPAEPLVKGAAAPADLDEALAAGKAGTITAIGADGKTRVHVPGQRTLAETDTYTVRLEAPASASHDQAVAVTLHVIPKTGWKINQEFPTKLTVTPPAGVVVAKATQSANEAASFTEAAAAFAVGFRASDAGKKDFTANLRFAVCTESTCDPKKEELAWAVELE